MTRESKTSPRSPVAFENVFNVELRARNRERRAGFRRLAAAEAAGGPCRNDPLPPLELVEIRLDDLKLATRRLRKRDPAHVREIANAIARLGYSRPILVGRDNEVIDGESVVGAARLLGFDRLTCVRVDHLSASEQRVLRLAINRLAEKGEWDLEALKIEFEELVVVEAPIEIAGFAGDEVDNVLSLDGDNEDGVERGPLSPEPCAQPTARVGHLYQLGPHRLICGDATDPAVLRRLLRAGSPARGGQPIDAIARARPTVRIVLTDEPYNVPIAGHVTGGRHREFAMASGEMTPSEYLAFNEAWMAASLPHVISGGLLATFIDWRGYPTVDAAAVGLGLAPLNLIVWAKTNAGQGSFYRSQFELLPLFKKGDAPHVNNIGLGKRGRWRSNLWTYPGASSLGSDARRGLAEHPTVKPTAMLEDALVDLTERGDVILDPFLGSGSTLIAAHRLGRICRGVEIDPRYVDLIVRRFEAETGLKAVLVDSGETTLNASEARQPSRKARARRDRPSEGAAPKPEPKA